MMTETSTPTPIDSTDDVIDVRDIIARVEHLEQLRQAGPVEMGDDNGTDQDTLFSELAELEALLSDLNGMGGDEQWRGDWYPLTLIAESYFENYARELAIDCAGSREESELLAGNGRGEHWPFTCMTIDWERAARDLKTDYSSVDFNGKTYWTR